MPGLSKLLKPAGKVRNALAQESPFVPHSGAHTPQTISSGMQDIDRILNDPVALAGAARGGFMAPGQAPTPEEVEQTRRLLEAWRRQMATWGPQSGKIDARLVLGLGTGAATAYAGKGLYDSARESQREIARKREEAIRRATQGTEPPP